MSPSITIVPLSYFSSIGLLFLYIYYIHIIYLNIFFLFGYCILFYRYHYNGDLVYI